MDRRGVLTGVLAAPLTALLGGAGPAAAGPAPAAGPARDPAGALAELLAGNRRFVAGEPRHGHHHTGGSAGQQPFGLVLGCIDSRVPVEAVFDQRTGDIFVARSAGQVLDRAVLGSIEFAVAKFGVPLVLVLGHSRCGAVQATLDAVRDRARPGSHSGYLVDQIRPAVRAAGGLDAPAVTRAQVRLTAARLRQLRPLRRQLYYGTLEVAGAVYDVDAGRVEPLP